MTLNGFRITAHLDYSPESIDSFVNICEGLISYVTADPSARYLLKSAVDEFTVNSIKHGYKKSSGEITLNIQRLENQINLEISDQGVGLDPSTVNMDREARTEEDLQSGGWAMSILNHISNGVNISTNNPTGAIISLSIPLPFNP